MLYISFNLYHISWARAMCKGTCKEGRCDPPLHRAYPWSKEPTAVWVLPRTGIQFSSVQLLSSVRLFATPWIIARQASLSITNSRSSLKLINSVMPSSHLILWRPSMGFSRQEYLSGLSCPPPGNLPNPGIEPRSPILQAHSLPTELQGKAMLSLVMWKENTLKIWVNQ